MRHSNVQCLEWRRISNCRIAVTSTPTLQTVDSEHMTGKSCIPPAAYSISKILVGILITHIEGCPYKKQARINFDPASFAIFKWFRIPFFEDVALHRWIKGPPSLEGKIGPINSWKWATRSLVTSGPDHPLKQRHIPEQWNSYLLTPVESKLNIIK